MPEEALTPVTGLVIKVLRAFDHTGTPYVVGGSFASSAWGHPRQTLDLDVAVLIEATVASRVADLFADEFLLSREEIQEAISDDGPFPSFQLIHIEEAFKIDVFVLDRSPYTDALLARRRLYRLSADYEAAFASPEDIVVAKLRWYELGRRVSDRQWNDIVQVLEVQKGAIDDVYLDNWAVYFGVGELLQTARSQAGLSEG